MIFSTIMKPLVKEFYKKLPFLKNNLLWSIFQISRTYILVCLGYAFFWTGSIKKGFMIVKNIFHKNSFCLLNFKQIVVPCSFAVIFLITEAARAFDIKVPFINTLSKNRAIKYIIYTSISIIVLLMLVREKNYASFIYYRF